jgi:hypothetical protein
MKMMKFVKFPVMFFALLAMPSTAFAAPTYSGLNTIKDVVAFQSGNVIFTIASAPSSAWSSCNYNHQFVINTGNTGGRALYDLVLTAQQNGKTVYVVGSGTCTLASGAEDIDFVQINP